MRPLAWLVPALLLCACHDLSDPDLELDETEVPLQLEDPAHIAYVKAPNPNAANAFGSEIAIDGETLLIGATHERSRTGDPNDDSGIDNGAAYVRVRNGGKWSHQAYFKSSPIADFEYFATDVAIDGDTAVIGERGGRGSVHVFERSGTVWTRTAILRPPPDQAPRRFGAEVAISGNLIAIGDEGDASRARGVGGNPGNLDAPYSGAVFVYRRKGNWTLDAYIKASNSEAFDFFGSGLVLSGNTLAVASLEDSNATGVNGNQANNAAQESGAVYVFERSGGRWTQRAYLKASNTEAWDGFGSMALAGDTLAIGASGEDSDATGVDGDQQSNEAEESGAVYVFRRAGASWSQEAYIKASNTDSLDHFGSPLTLSGDRLAVGAYLEDSSAVGIDGDQLDNSAANAGAVYLFEREGASWSQAHYIKASNTDPDDQFGGELAMDDQRLVVGASSEASCAAAVNGDQADNRCPGKGAVYIIE
jgi:trimeric autotransporter adhesin